MLTAARLNTNVPVQSRLSSASVQSLAIALRTGRRMKYEAIRMKTKMNDRMVALSSFGSMRVAARTIRLITPLSSSVMEACL
jgi:hypothetical protein